MPRSHGVVQGYNGIESVDKRMRNLDPKRDVFATTVVTADTGFHSEASVRTLLDRKTDAYVAGTHFRKRDPRFADHQQHKAKTTNKRRTSKKRKYFTACELRPRCINRAV